MVALPEQVEMRCVSSGKIRFATSSHSRFVILATFAADRTRPHFRHVIVRTLPAWETASSYSVDRGIKPCGSFFCLRPWFHLAPWDFWQPAKTNVDKNAFWGREHFGPSYFSHVGPSGAFKWYQPDQNLLTIFALSATNCWANCTARMICLCPVLCTPWRRRFEHR
jgi:hypothetical protein